MVNAEELEGVVDLISTRLEQEDDSRDRHLCFDSGGPVDGHFSLRTPFFDFVTGGSSKALAAADHDVLSLEG